MNWRRAWLGLAALGSTLLLQGCEPPEEQVVARELGNAAFPDAGSAQLKTPRGRVSIVDGRLVTDIGTPLRGLILPVDVGWTLDDFGLMTSIAQTTGFNTVHVYLENWAQTSGANVSAGDALVSLTAQAGLYLVLGIGGGMAGNGHPAVGWFDIDKVTSFWNFYAPRYKDSTHVLFEIQNTPELTCSDPVQENTISMEREAYTLIRSFAPDTHVVLFSSNSLPAAAVVGDAIARVSDVVDWSNASFGVDPDDSCTAITDFGGVLSTAQGAGAPMFVLSLPVDGWAPYVDALEPFEVGWMHHRWLSVDGDLTSLIQQTSQNGMSWCPDVGTFPLDATTCRAP